MRLLIALFFPWLQFLTMSRPLSGIACLLLQMTLIGWPAATIWSISARSQYRTDQKIARAFANAFAHQRSLG